jgi:hypothetical protein
LFLLNIHSTISIFVTATNVYDSPASRIILQIRTSVRNDYIITILQLYIYSKSFRFLNLILSPPIWHALISLDQSLTPDIIFVDCIVTTTSSISNKSQRFINYLLIQCELFFSILRVLSEIYVAEQVYFGHQEIPNPS